MQINNAFLSNGVMSEDMSKKFYSKLCDFTGGRRCVLCACVCLLSRHTLTSRLPRCNGPNPPTSHLTRQSHIKPLSLHTPPLNTPQPSPLTTRCSIKLGGVLDLAYTALLKSLATHMITTSPTLYSLH